MNTNPQYQKLFPLWQVVDDVYAGLAELLVPAKQVKYLRPFPSEKSSGLGEDSTYSLRCYVADFDNIFKDAVSSMVGVITRKPANIRWNDGNEEETPEEVKELEIYGNLHNDGLKGIKSRLNAAQILHGRAGLLLDIAIGQNSNDPKFVIKEYDAKSILDGENYISPKDGKKKLKWILLNESTMGFDRVTKQRKTVYRYRIMGIDGKGLYYTSVLEGDDADSQWESFDFDNPTNPIYPVYWGRYLDFIPFTVCNVDRLGIDEWQTPPFLDVAYSTLKAYNSDSIYRKALHDHSSPTLVIANAKPKGKIILGGLLEIEGSNGDGNATANLIETSGAGLAQHGASVESIKKNALQRTIKGMLDAAGASSSGEALQLRSAAGTATLSSIDNASARAIEEQLCFAAIWAGATEEEAGQRISYTVDTSYMGDGATLQEFVSMMTANRAGGTPFLSKRNLYALLQQKHATVLSSFEDNELQIEEEGYDAGPAVIPAVNRFPAIGDTNNDDE